MTTPRRALIVGAGIGGLAAGVALGRAGWQVRIHERAASPRELGFALLLAPNAMAALEELGLAETVRAAGVPATRFEVRHADGRVIRAFRAQPGGRMVVALRPVLHGALLDAVGRETLALDSEVVGVTSTNAHAELTLKDGRTERADVVIGADGVGSAVRRLLHPDEAAPAPSGFSALRGVAHGVADRLGHLAGVGYLGPGIEAAAARASAESVYWYLSLLSADVSGWPKIPRDVADRATRGFDPRFRAIIDATTDDDMRLDDLFVRRPLRQWGAGRITLLGDAAHPVLPHTAQGAAQALEDAVALGLALRRHDDVEAALRDYERVRRVRTSRLIAMGPRIAAMTTTRSPARIAIRTALLRFVPEPLLAKGGAGGGADPHRALRSR
jgi:2-polyprenyl-6-methoxyphenol hydroxylase-like FAD-dependent oxidoreductase